MELADVRQSDVDAVASQRVDVHLGELENTLGTDIRSPNSCISKEETLLRSEAVHLVLVDLTLSHSVHHSKVADVQTSVVGDVLTEGEGTVGIGFRIVENLDSVEGVDKDLLVVVEVLRVFLGPPVVEVAVLVVVATLVVEAVGQLVTDDNTNSAIVSGIVSIELEERRLEDSCGEADFVGCWVVVGVDRLRSHTPLIAVDGLVDLAEHIIHIELVAANDVGIVAVVLDFKSAVVTPFVGIANLYVDSAELSVCVGLGLIGHPSSHIDALSKSLDKVVDEDLHTLFGLCGEILLDIEFAKSLTHSAVNDVGDAFPTGTVDFLAAHLLAVEVELSIDEVVAEVRGSSIDLVPSEVSLDGVDVGISQSLVDLGETFGSSDVEALHTVKNVHRGEITLPVDVGSEFGCLIKSVSVEGCEGVTAFELSQVRLSKAGFEVHNHLGEFVGLDAAHLVVAGHSEEFGHQLDITDAELSVVALVKEVVVAVAKAQTCLVSPSNALFGVVLVSLAENAEEYVVATMVHLEDLIPDVLTGLKVVDFLEVGLEGFATLLLQTDAVHTDVVERSDLVGNRASFVLVGRDRVDDALELLLVLLCEEIERAVARVLSIERVVLHPAAAGVLIEVFERRHGCVKVVEVDTRSQFGFLVTTRSD